MRSKLSKRPRRQLPDILSEALLSHCIEGIQQFVHRATSAFIFSKRTLPRQGVCVCHICKDVKLLQPVHLSRGMERTYEAPSNEAPHMILGYHQGRLVTYLQFEFFRNSKGPSSEPQPPCYTICCTVVAIWNQFWSFMISSAASEPSSVFSPKPCRRQYF